MNESWYNPLSLMRAMLGHQKPDILTADPSEYGRKTRTRIQQLRNRKRFKQRKSRSR